MSSPTPGHADTVYVTNLQMWKSTDGGASFTEVTTRHGDNHDLWIDPNDPNAHDRGQRRRRQRLVQRRRLVVDDLQPEDGAVLPHRHRQPVSLPRLRHAAGQHLDLGAERLGMGRHHAGRLHLSRHRRERLHRRRSRGPQHRLCRRRRLEPGRRRRAAALRPSHAPDPAGQRVAGGIDRHRAQGPEVPLRLDLPDRVLAARSGHALCRRQLRVPHAATRA